MGVRLRWVSCATNPSYGKLIVPSAPSTYSCRPIQPISPASVTTNDGTPILVTITPCSTPIRAHASTTAAIPTTSATPMRTVSAASIAPARPETEPTDRSISPSSSTSTTPTEIAPVAAIWSVRL
ncbi:MAG: hypothetical protein ACRDT6_06040 [Micromonosporaceae bacterium]